MKALNSGEGREPAREPASYRDVQRQQLLVLVSEGMTKVKACQIVGVPAHVVSKWIANDPLFRSAWVAARMEQAHALADAVIDIADEECADQVAVMRNRNRMDARKWFTSKTSPADYGQHVRVDHTHMHGVVLLPAVNANNVRQIRLAEGGGEVLSEVQVKTAEELADD